MTKKVISIDDLIRNKSEVLKKKEKKTVAIHVPSLGGDIVCKIPTFAEMELALDKKGMNQFLFILEKIIVEPSLNEKELMEAYEVRSKQALIGKLFTELEIQKIMEVIAVRVQEENKGIELVEELKGL